MLSESVVVWGKSSGQGKNLIVLKDGKIIRSDLIPADKKPPAPLGHAAASRRGRTCFDIMTLDRMRVLTTELRRLVSRGALVEVWLRPGVVLRNEALGRLFLWV